MSFYALRNLDLNDPANAANCVLSDLGTRTCEVKYTIQVKTLNDTIADIATGKVIFESECLTLAQRSLKEAGWENLWDWRNTA